MDAKQITSPPVGGQPAKLSPLRCLSGARREDYFSAIIRGEMPPLIVISGLPGAGKTTILGMMQADGERIYHPATRYMPRERRPSDTSGDLPWTLHCGDKEGVIFANSKYQGIYAFPADAVLDALSQGKSPVMLVTSHSEMFQLAEALHNLLPAAPLATLRVEVPIDVLPNRIKSRSGAHPQEDRERIERLGKLVQADQLQTPLLRATYGTRVVFNITGKELEGYGYFSSQIQPLSPGLMNTILVEAIDDAVSRAKREAQDIMEPRQLTYGMRAVPDPIVAVLDRVLLPTAKRVLPADGPEALYGSLVIKAGLAAAIYLGDLGRPVSPDIDFTLVGTPMAKQQMELLMENLGASTVWNDGSSKAVYHCEGLKGEAQVDRGATVELDALLVTRVQPDPKGFCFVCQHDEHDLFHRRIVITPVSNRFGLVPPEQLCVEKLLAGRGPEIHKFDLFDAAGILAKYHLNPSLIKKMVEVQSFDPVIDRAVVDVLALADYSLSTEVLTNIGITEPSIQMCVSRLVEQEEAATANLKRECEGGAVDLSALGLALPSGVEPWERKQMSLKSLKQLAFLNAVERSLCRIEAGLRDEVFTIGESSVSIGGRFGEVEVQEGVLRLRAQVRLLAEFHVGSVDSYVHRGTNEDEMRRFFRGLPEQRSRLTPEEQGHIGVKS